MVTLSTPISADVDARMEALERMTFAKVEIERGLTEPLGDHRAER